MTARDETGARDPLPVFEPAADRSVHPTFDVRELAQRTGYRPATDWTIPEAFLCLILLAAAADGFVPPEEHMEIRALARRSRVLKSVDLPHLAQLNRIVSERLKHRPEGLREACEALPADMRPSILAHCADILLADGGLAPAEAEFLNRITAYLGLRDEDARSIVEVLMVKNRY
ncbi:conserved hypothetical protein [uncultured Defluviicoccus sp.]|uniref:Co-chaperone DjlA N-terminal domain-containing protein n=1 Tax=metagenome TaxID=256318 RepID=A0A380T7G3_9ZZZZ|nr:conserved hypothetical protein [uncultured Defluviicoccus sp.]